MAVAVALADVICADKEALLSQDRGTEEVGAVGKLLQGVRHLSRGRLFITDRPVRDNGLTCSIPCSALLDGQMTLVPVAPRRNMG